MSKLKWCVVIVLLFYSCIWDNRKQSKNSKFETILDHQKEMLVNKDLRSFKEIFSDSLKLSNKVILLYNGFDCEKCINLGFQIVKKIDSLSKIQKCFIVATSSNINRLQILNNYQDYIYLDEKGKIRKELKFIYTPVLLKLDSLARIEDAYFLGKVKSKKQENDFVLRCLGGV